jgi:sulfate adenylyltransferase
MEITLNLRQKCDFEMIVNGGFKPLKGFLKEKDYLSVCQKMRLSNGELWTIPITLPINAEQANTLKHYSQVVLKDLTGLPLGKLLIDSDSIFSYDWKKEARNVFGSDDVNHPYTSILKEQWENGYTFYLGGEIIDGVIPKHYDFLEYRLTPQIVREQVKDKNMVGFQTRNPMHCSHVELAKYALNQLDDNAILFLNPVVGITQDCDIDYHTRVRCYLEVLKHFPKDRLIFSLLPLSMRMAGPREAVWHALIRKNFGCTHFAVGRDHAGPSYKKSDGTDFYGPYDAQELLATYQEEIGITMIKSQMIVYCLNKETNEGRYCTVNDKKENEMVMNISGTQQRELLNNGGEIPEWFSYPEVVKILREEFPLLNQRGLCIYLVGLSGSGKTTLAQALIQKFKELLPTRKVTYLDGDIVRTHLSKGLGFSKEDRSTNIRRIGYVSSEVVKHNGLCLVANIAPFIEDRKYNKNLISKNGNYFQIWVNTTLEECEKRDVKGLYKLAREGKIKQFTGISDPFEEPNESDLIIDGNQDINNLIDLIISNLKEKKYL